MAAIAADLCNVLVVSVPAVVTTVLLISTHRASTSIMPAFVVVVSHKLSPEFVSNFAVERMNHALH